MDSRELYNKNFFISLCVSSHMFFYFLLSRFQIITFSSRTIFTLYSRKGETGHVYPLVKYSHPRVKSRQPRNAGNHVTWIVDEKSNSMSRVLWNSWYTFPRCTPCIAIAACTYYANRRGMSNVNVPACVGR